MELAQDVTEFQSQNRNANEETKVKKYTFNRVCLHHTFITATTAARRANTKTFIHTSCKTHTAHTERARKISQQNVHSRKVALEQQIYNEK